MPDISALAQELLRREMATHPEQFEPQKLVDLGPNRGTKQKTIDPHKFATIAGLADAATTYGFLRRGTTESNAMLKGTKGRPAATALAALGGLAASKGLTKLVGKFSPRAADALAANLGTLQAAYSVGNLDMDETPSRGSSPTYQGAMTRKVIAGK